MNDVNVPNVVVVGTGFGGLEAAFYLRKAPRQARPGDDRERERGVPLQAQHDLHPVRQTARGVRVRAAGRLREATHSVRSCGRASASTPKAKKLIAGGNPIPYDYLFLATGAAMRAEEIPGLAENANTIWTPEEMMRLRGSLDGVLERAKAGTEDARPFPRPAEEQVRRTALRDGHDARQLAAQEGRARPGRHRVLHVREGLHPGVRSSPERRRDARVQAPRDRRPQGGRSSSASIRDRSASRTERASRSTSSSPFRRTSRRPGSKGCRRTIADFSPPIRSRASSRGTRTSTSSVTLPTSR